MDDTHYFEPTANVFYIQASYDLRDTPCAPDQSDMCLLTLDGTDGTLKAALWTNWTAYKYSQQASSDGNLLTFVEGFDSTCQDPYNNFAFATVNLASASATLINCISHNATIDMDEWISSFSLDDSLMATASGDAEAGAAQLLVFDTKSGNSVLNTALTGLAQALGAAEGLFDVWSADFA